MGAMGVMGVMGVTAAHEIELQGSAQGHGHRIKN